MHVQGIQKNRQHFEPPVTAERLMCKIKGDATGCGNVRSLDPS